MPQLTKFYGLKPCDIDAMTLREVVVYRRQMAKYLDDERRAQDG